MTIGEKIRYYRETLGITQDDLAEVLKTTPQNIYKYERGIITNIPLSSIEALAETFNISIKEFLGWDKDHLVFDENEPDIRKKAFSLGSNIKNRRLELGIDDITFSKKLGIVLEKIHDYENGNFNNIEAKLLMTISEILETSVQKLMTYSADTNDDFSLTDDEKALILAYREHPEFHPMIYKLLNFTPSSKPQTEDGKFKYPVLTSDEFSRIQPRTRVASRRLKYGAAPGEDPYEDVSKLKPDND